MSVFSSSATAARHIVSALILAFTVAPTPSAIAQPFPQQPRDDSHWIPVAGTDDFYSTTLPSANAMDALGRIVVGFNVAPNLSSQRGFVIVARFDPSTAQWDRLGGYIESGLVSTGVRELIALSNGDVFVGGNFLSAVNADGTSIPVSGVARWNDSAQRWDNLGGGVSGPVETIDATPNGDVCVGGHFASGLNGVNPSTELNNVGCWDGNSWYALGGGVEFGTFPAVRNLAVAPNGNIVVVGSFTQTYETAGGSGTARGHIALWNGNNWQSLAGGLTTPVVDAVVADGTNIFLSGNPVTASTTGPTVAGRVILWDGSQWVQHDAGIATTFVRSLTLSGSGVLYVLDARNVYRRRPADPQWESVGTVQSGFLLTGAAAVAATDDLYVGGNFADISAPQTAAVAAVAHARWDGTSWHALSRGGSAQPDNDILAATIAAGLIAGGKFTQLGFYPASRIGFLEDNSWFELGGGMTEPDSATVNAIETTSPSPFFEADYIFVGGYFAEIRNEDTTPVEVSNVAMFDVDARTWHSLGQGVNGPVHALEYYNEASLSALYVGGEFTEATNHDGSTVEVNGIARYNFDAQRWEALGGGVIDGTTTAVVYALTSGRRQPTAPEGPEPWSHDLFVGGHFDAALSNDGSPVSGTKNLAWFSTREDIWRGVGQGADSTVRALAYIRHYSISTDVANAYNRGVLYAGGDFGVVRNGSGTNVIANHLAKWTIHDNNWAIIGQDLSTNGLDGPVYSLEIHGPITRPRWLTSVGLIIGGEFTYGFGSDGIAMTLNNLALLADYEPAFDRPDNYYYRETFFPFGSGTDAAVYDTALLSCAFVTGISETMYAAGAFSNAGGKSSRALAKWRYVLYPPSAKQVAVKNSSPCINCTTAVASWVPPSVCTSGVQKLAGKYNAGRTDIVLFEDLGFGDDAAVIAEELPLDLPIPVDISSSGSTLATIDSVIVESWYPTLLTLTGVLDPQNYASNPDGRGTQLSIHAIDLPVLDETAPAGAIGVAFLNAVTDAPGVDLALQGGSTIATDIPYGGVNLQPITLQAGAHVIEVSRHSDGGLLGTYPITLSDPLTAIILEGFADPAANHNGPPMRLAVVDVSSILQVTTEEHPQQIQVAELEPNYPNPFSRTTMIRYRIPTPTPVKLSVYDLLGRRVAVLVDEQQQAGTWSIPFDADGLAAGVYIYELSTGSYRRSRRLVVVR